MVQVNFAYKLSLNILAEINAPIAFLPLLNVEIDARQSAEKN